MANTNTLLESLCSILHSTGELEIRRSTDEEAYFGKWSAYAPCAGWVHGSSPEDLINEIVIEAMHHGMKELPFIQIELRREYLERRKKRMKEKIDAKRKRSSTKRRVAG